MKTPKQDLEAIWGGIAFIFILPFLILAWPFKWVSKRFNKDWMVVPFIFFIFMLYHYWLAIVVVGGLGIAAYLFFWV